MCPHRFSFINKIRYIIKVIEDLTYIQYSQYFIIMYDLQRNIKNNNCVLKGTLF